MLKCSNALKLTGMSVARDFLYKTKKAISCLFCYKAPVELAKKWSP